MQLVKNLFRESQIPSLIDSGISGSPSKEESPKETERLKLESPPNGDLADVMEVTAEEGDALRWRSGVRSGGDAMSMAESKEGRTDWEELVKDGGTSKDEG